MTNNSLKDTIQNHMKNLPQDVQEAIHASSWERKILDIGRKYGLHVDQLEILQTELSLAVLGLTDRSEFVRETMREARIDKHVMETMVMDINREIFEPIRERLRQSRQYEYEVEREDTESTTGLERHEEETLKKHGVSFNLDEEQDLPVKQMFVEPETIVPEEKKPTLETPLRLQKNQIGEKQTTSFDDIIKSRSTVSPEVQPFSENTKTEQIATVSKVETPKNPFEINLNPNTLPSVNTEGNQQKITETRKPFYEKGDPYREPIG